MFSVEGNLHVGWVTIWYAGVMVSTLGFQGLTSEQCDMLKQTVEIDIAASYAHPLTERELSVLGFPLYEKWNVTCELYDYSISDYS